MAKDGQKEGHKPLKEILGEIVSTFHIPELKKLVDGYRDPFDARDPEEMVEIMQSNQELLEKVEREHITQYGMTVADMKNFMGNPGNFSPEQWQKLESVKKDLKKYQNDLITSSEEGMVGELIEKGMESLKKKRKKKKKKLNRFGARKNWMQL